MMNKKPPKFFLHEDTVMFADDFGGAILLKDQRWYPFTYTKKGVTPLYNECTGYTKYRDAYEHSLNYRGLL